MCLKGDVHAPLCPTIRQMAKAREECQLSGFFQGRLPGPESTWKKYMGTIGGNHICTDTSSARAGQHMERADVLLSLPLLNFNKF